MTAYSTHRRVLVAHNTPRGGWGGMARMMESLHTALEAYGWQTDYFTSTDMPSAGATRFDRYAFSWFARRHARRTFLAGNPYALINVHEPSGVAFLFNRARIGSPAIVAMSHGLEQRHWETRLQAGPLGGDYPDWKSRVSFPLTSLWQSRLTLRRAAHVLCLSHDDKDYLTNRLGIAPGSITRVFPAAGELFAAARRDYARPCERLLFSGTWIARKGNRQLVAAFTALSALHPSLRLGILGAGVPPDQVLADFPSTLHARISVLPALDHQQCVEVLLDHDILILPSLFEGTPLALIEAMSTGIPVIATAVCGIKDVVDHGGNGILILPEDSKEIVRSVEQLITSPALREKLGTQAHFDAARKYSWQSTAAIVNRIYSALVSPVAHTN